jgi:hypothetical protein
MGTPFWFAQADRRTPLSGVLVTAERGQSLDVLTASAP